MVYQNQGSQTYHDMEVVDVHRDVGRIGDGLAASVEDVCRRQIDPPAG